MMRDSVSTNMTNLALGVEQVYTSITSKKMRILSVDNHENYFLGLCLVLETLQTIAITGCAENPETLGKQVVTQLFVIVQTSS
jgi:hypothetical protein